MGFDALILSLQSFGCTSACGPQCGTSSQDAQGAVVPRCGALGMSSQDAQGTVVPRCGMSSQEARGTVVPRCGSPEGLSFTRDAELVFIVWREGSAFLPVSEHHLLLEKLTHREMCFLATGKTGLVQFEAIAFRGRVLSTGDSDSLSQHTADNKMLHNLRECLCLSQRFISPRTALFPGVSSFLPPFTRPHTILKQRELVLPSKPIPRRVSRVNKEGGA